MDPIEQFKSQVQENISLQGKDEGLSNLGMQFMTNSMANNYSYNFTWMGRPIIQFPQDLVAMQEIIWEVKPDLIIEMGIAHGGSLIFYASMLELLGEDGRVVAVDIDIREHNRVEIEKHPMAKRITMIEGSAIDEQIAEKVRGFVKEGMKVLVVLDSFHTHDHVLKELELYSPLVTKDSYLVVFDTVVEDLPEDSYPDRPWGKGNNPKTAAWEFLKHNDRFVIDEKIQNKLVMTVAPDGYLKCIKD
jgi:cephalosporin hydroxylase